MKKWNLFILGFLLFCPLFITAQEQMDTIQILDNTTQGPIAGAVFRYHNQAGHSDVRGNIRLIYQKPDTLFLSHIGYGKWFLTDVDLHTAIRAGFIYREMEMLTLQPVTVIALRPKSHTTEKYSLEVRDKLAHDAANILTRVPLISAIRKSGAYGFDPVLRGFKYDQVNVVLNGGQCAVAACPNRMDPPSSQIAPNMIEHVEIIKGPHSFRYGTAFGGTINFESVPVRFAPQRQYYGRLSNSLEHNGEIYRTEGVAGFSGNRCDLSMFASFSRGNDYKDGGQNSVAADFRRASFGGSLGLRLAGSQQVSFSITENIAGDTDFPALPMDLRSDRTTLLNSQHKITLNRNNLKSWKTMVYVTLVDHDMDNLHKKLDPRMINAQTEAHTRSYGGRTEGTWLFKNSKLYSGIDVKIESADGERSREFLTGPMTGNTVYDNVWNGGQISKAGLFGEYHLYFPSFKLIGSARLEYNRAEAGDPHPDFAALNRLTKISRVSPNVSLGGYREFAGGFSTGVWLGRAERCAGISERYINSFPVGLDAYDMLGNPELEPEINNQADVTVGFRNSRTQVDVSLFASFLENYISSEIDTALTPTMPSSPGVRRFVNIKEAQMAGFELTWKQTLFSGLEHFLSLAYTFGKDKVRNEPLPEIAPLDVRYSITGSWFNHRLRPSLTLRQVMRQDRISTVFGETKTPSFFLTNLAVTGQLGKHAGATAGIQNLFDRAYYEHLNRRVKGLPRSIYAPGRNIYLTVFINLM